MTLPLKDWTIWALYICNRCFWDLEPNSGPDSVLYGWLCCYVQVCIALIEENGKGQAQQLVSWSCRKESSSLSHEMLNAQMHSTISFALCGCSESVTGKMPVWLDPSFPPPLKTNCFVATGERKCYIDTICLVYLIG